MTDMTLVCDLFKKIAKEIPAGIHGTALLVAMWKKLGVNDTQELADLCRVSRSMVQKSARKGEALSPNAENPSPIAAEPVPPPSGTHSTKVEPVHPASGTRSVSAEPVPPSGTCSSPRAPARAHFDSNPSCEEVSNTPLPSVGPPAEKPKRVMGSRLPDDWTLPEDWFQWARINHVTVPAETVRAMGVKFGNYWKTRTDKVACKRRWDLAWQNWCDTEWGAVKKTGQPMNWGRNAYEQRQPKGIDWEAVDARVAELNRRSEVQGHA